MTCAEIQAELMAATDEKYRDFNGKLAKSSLPMLGVRIPELRQIALRIAREGDFAVFWRKYPWGSFENVMLRGMAIGYIQKPEYEAVKGYITEFLPHAASWAHIDCVVASLKCTVKFREQFYPFLMDCIASDSEFTVRFGVIMLMSYYITENEIDNTLKILGAVHSTQYYVQMGVAWAVSVGYVKFPEKTRQVLLNNLLEPTTHNMAIRKIVDSYRVCADDKAFVKTLKRQKSAN